MLRVTNDSKIPMKAVVMMRLGRNRDKVASYFSFIGTMMYFFSKISNLEVHLRTLS